MTYLAKLNKISGDFYSTLSSVTLVVFDVDGVLTDGKLYYGKSGEEIKSFHVRDGVGIKLLQDNGVDVAVITAKDSSMVATRMGELGVKYYFPGVKDKQAKLQALSSQAGHSNHTVCYVGDDMVDLPAMSISGLKISPSDAYELVQQQVDIVVPVNGGKGVARFVADLILNAKGNFEKAYKISMTPEFERKR